MPGSASSCSALAELMSSNSAFGAGAIFSAGAIFAPGAILPPAAGWVVWAIDGAAASRPRVSAARLGARLQRLVDLDLQHAVEILRGHRSDQLVEDGAVAADHKGLGHAIDAPFDRGPAVAVDADDPERIAVAAEEAAGVVRR